MMRSIDDLPLSIRTQFCLKHLGVKTVDQLLNVSETTLLGVGNFGRVSMVQLYDALDAIGLVIAPRINFNNGMPSNQPMKERLKQRGIDAMTQMNFHNFLNRVRALYNIDFYRLPEMPAEHWEQFRSNPVAYLINLADKPQQDAIWREVQYRTLKWDTTDAIAERFQSSDDLEQHT